MRENPTSWHRKLRGTRSQTCRAAETRGGAAQSHRCRAEQVCRFIGRLKITAGMHAGRRFKLRPWQREIIEALYATDGDGHRAQTIGADLPAAENRARSTLAAALALAHLVGPEAEQRGQIVSRRGRSRAGGDPLQRDARDDPRESAPRRSRHHPRLQQDRSRTP